MSWYDENNPSGAEENDWYKPNYTKSSFMEQISRLNAELEQENAVKRPEAQLPGGRKTRGVALVVCALLILFGAVYAFFNADSTSDAVNDDGMPKSYQTYLEDYYSTSSATPADIRLEKVTDRGSLTLRTSTGAAQTLSFSEIFDKCSPSVVGIKCVDGKDAESYSWGSGIVVSSDGYILTNTHVIDGSDRATVTLSSGESCDAKLVAADSQTDIAILKIEKTGLKAATFANSAAVRTGESVCAIGNPLSPDYSLTMTSGIISATDREVSYNGTVMTLLQTDTSINGGNSGGALFNDRGEVIGITNMKIVSSYSNVEGIGFAIPSNTIESVVKALMQDGAVYGRSTIGVTVGPISEDIADYYNIPNGLYVSEVLENSDAQKQGIKKGDIIVKVNGVDAHATSDIAEAKAKLSVGDTIDFTIWRSGETFDVSVKIMDAADIYNSK